MKTQILLIIILLALISSIFLSCTCDEIIAEPCGIDPTPNSEYCGWTVATCFGTGRRQGNTLPIDPDAAVAVIYNTSDNLNAPRGTDWGTTIQTIHPPRWTSKDLGQVFGIALDNQDNIYLASSDIYVFDDGWDARNCASGNTSRPFGCGAIFKCSPPTWDPVLYVDLPNACDVLNGIGNVVFDKWHNQIFASNLEDGKIYRLSMTGDIIEAYDPWIQDDGSSGIVVESERIWGIGVNFEGGNAKLYFARVLNSNDRKMFSLQLNSDGSFPSLVSEIVEINTLPNNQTNFYDPNGLQFLNIIVSDISFSQDGTKMAIAERGYPHNTAAYGFELIGGSWTYELQYNIGSQASDIYRQNSGGGLDYAPIGTNEDSSKECDGNIIVSTNWFLPRNAGNSIRYYGVQGISASGNLSSMSSMPTANIDTDFIIDFNGTYDTEDKETVGDVEVFDCTECEDPCLLNQYN